MVQRTLWDIGQDSAGQAWANRLYYGDNLNTLRRLLRDSSVRGQVRLVYIDPPFGTGQNFTVSIDRRATISRASDGAIAYEDNLAGKDYLKFMRLRLENIRQLLADDGSIYVPRSPKEVKPLELFGVHEAWDDDGNKLCKDNFLCHVCAPAPDTVAYLLGVGEKFYSTQNFLAEAQMMGISKRIHSIPKHLKLGETWVYLIHRKAIKGENGQPDRMVVFAAFVPQRIEMLVWQSEATPERLAELERRGIRVVVVPDGERDHA